MSPWNLIMKLKKVVQMNFTLEIGAYRHYHEWLTETDVNAETIFGVKSRWTTLNIHTRNALHTSASHLRSPT